MRHGLLMTAVATVAVPGLLAILAVVGHEHVGGEAGVTAAALDGTPLSGTVPMTSAAASAAVRTNVAAVTVNQQVMGVHLLDSAAVAGLSTSYQGTELISQTSVDGSVEMTSQVWHQGGGQTLVETSSGTSPAATRAAASADVASSAAASGSPEGVFGVTKSLVALINKHYVPVYQGAGAAVGRAAAVVELYRFDGSLAARYWLDKQTMVPLRRELFDTSENVISQDSFVQVKFGSLAVPQVVAAGAVQSQATPQLASQSVWIAAVSPGRFLTSLARQGWQVPDTLPGGLPLYEAGWTKTASGKVVNLDYSDGLYVVSLFVQRGTLAPDMPGWRQVSVAGRQAFVSGHSVTWAELGFVYTAIADAPPQTVAQVVETLPRSGPPGALDRLGRGFMRLARDVLNPFG